MQSQNSSGREWRLFLPHLASWHHPRNHKLSWVDLGFRCMDTQVISNCTPSVISSLIKLLLSFVMFHMQQCCPTYNGIVSYAAMLPNTQWYCFIRSNAAQHTMAYAAMLPNIQWYCFIHSNAAQHTVVLFHTQQCCPAYNGIVSYAAMLPMQHTMAYAAMLPNVQWYCFIRSNAAQHTMVLFHTQQCCPCNIQWHMQQCCPTYNGIVSYASMLPYIQWYCFIRSNAALHTMVLFVMLAVLQ